MKIYPKRFENVFSEDHIYKGRYDFSKISIKEMELDDYARFFGALLKKFSDELFLFYVKATWLKKRFFYNGKQIEAKGPSGGALDYVFSRFLRRVVGSDTQFFTRDFLYPKISSYFKDFFPGFNEGDPFKNEDFYKFPFKNITIEFSAVVYQLDDRIRLLKYADEQKMTYAKFLDFIINQIYSINEEIGRDRYIFVTSRNCQNYVRDTDKKLFSIKKISKKIK